MSITVNINVCDSDMEYSHNLWDAGEMILSDVNKVLKELGIDVEFNLNVHDEMDMPENTVEITKND